MGSGIEPNFSDAHHVGMVKGLGANQRWRWGGRTLIRRNRMARWAKMPGSPERAVLRSRRNSDG